MSWRATYPRSHASRAELSCGGLAGTEKCTQCGRWWKDPHLQGSIGTVGVPPCARQRGQERARARDVAADRTSVAEAGRAGGTGRTPLGSCGLALLLRLRCRSSERPTPGLARPLVRLLLCGLSLPVGTHGRGSLGVFVGARGGARSGSARADEGEQGAERGRREPPSLRLKK